MAAVLLKAAPFDVVHHLCSPSQGESSLVVRLSYMNWSWVVGGRVCQDLCLIIIFFLIVMSHNRLGFYHLLYISKHLLTLHL